MKLPPWLFWTDWAKKMFWDPFWWVIWLLIILWIPFLRVWWWVFLPIMLHSQLQALYFWYMNWDYDYRKAKWVIYELVPPKEILAPYKAMEDVYSVIWPLYDIANFRDKWCDGELDNGPYWCSLELASIEGKIHFYTRLKQEHTLSFETAMYAHYPEIEIRKVQDYTKLVPLNVPNEEWDTYGEDFDTVKPDAYPIKTYEKFFEPQGERISAEEKRIDPIVSLLEGMSKLGAGEYYWVHFVTVPITDRDEPEFFAEAKKIIAAVSKRPEKRKTSFMEDLMYVATQLIAGPAKEGSGEKATYKWLPQQKEETGERELLLTPGEREIVTEIENKLKKPLFRTSIRAVYTAKRESFTAAHKILARSYFAHFTTKNMNELRFQASTRPKVTYFWRNRRAFLRARRMFRMSVLRFPPLFPNRMSSDLNPILSTEEMATLYHLPLKISGLVAPTLERIESKKSGPPPNLPIE